MKFVVFCEGQSEEQLIRAAVDKSLQTVTFVDHYKDFLDAGDGHFIHIFDCGGHPNVFPRVSRAAYLYQAGERVIVMRDLEKTPCFSGLKLHMTEICSGLPLPPTSKAVFAKPNLEAVYFADETTLKRVVEIQHSRSFGCELDREVLENRIATLNHLSPSSRIKRLFRSYSMAYNKPRFAKDYFSRIDLASFPHSYVRRVMEVLHPAIGALEQ